MTISTSPRASTLGVHRVVGPPGATADPRGFSGTRSACPNTKALNRISRAEGTVSEFLGWLLLAGVLAASARTAASLTRRVVRGESTITKGLP